jgi:hypothetical protein
MMPRATAPEAIPLPVVDQRQLAQVARADDARAAAAEAKRLPSDVLALGSAFRELSKVDARGGDEVELTAARRHADIALRELNPRPELDDDLLALRALQTRHFLDAVARWEATGEKTTDLAELGGNFIERNEEAGWIVGRRVLLSEAQRRTAFKTVWNALAGVDSRRAFALTLDEQRDLYSFYLGHPHAPDSRRTLFATQRRDAKTPEACARVNAEEGRQAELWRAEKIKRLAAVDPSYPAAYALGVAYYRAGRYDLSAEAFTAFIGAQPEGAYSLRAKNHLKAALAAHGTL